MLLSREVEITYNSQTFKYYEDLGYHFTRYVDKLGNVRIKYNSRIKVNVDDLIEGSKIKVKVKCDYEYCQEPIKDIQYNNYKISVNKRNGKYFCKKCFKKICNFKYVKSFEQWCLENSKKDVLDRWDYELNDYKPDEIGCSTKSKKFWFKCPNNKHESELKNISLFTRGRLKNIECKSCNSFAQWGVDNLGEDFLDKYWDYEKNTVNPWDISKGNSLIKIYIKCQEKDYHESYDITCTDFIKGERCYFCNVRKKVHILDSLEILYPEVSNVWSEKNINNPYEYSFKSKKEVFWKCPEGKHEDYKRSISNSTRFNFRCPECQYSKGEERINNNLINNNWEKINQDEFDKLDNNYNMFYFIPQKTFEGLIGLGSGLLSYDFYLPKYNLLIEYQGQQHEKYIPGFHKSKKDFEKQQEHDRRKKEYAKNNNINFLEIWYWDFDNIETILEKELSKRMYEEVI